MLDTSLSAIDRKITERMAPEFARLCVELSYPYDYFDDKIREIQEGIAFYQRHEERPIEDYQPILRALRQLDAAIDEFHAKPHLRALENLGYELQSVKNYEE